MANDIGSRVKEVRNYTGYSLEQFGSLIGITRSSASLIERGVNTPSNQTLLLICIRFRVNEVWLKTGEGEMFADLTPSEEIEKFLKTLSTAPNNYFPKRLILYLAQMQDSGWERLEQVLDSILAGKDILFPPDQKSE